MELGRGRRVDAAEWFESWAAADCCWDELDGKAWRLVDCSCSCDWVPVVGCEVGGGFVRVVDAILIRDRDPLTGAVLQQNTRNNELFSRAVGGCLGSVCPLVLGVGPALDGDLQQLCPILQRLPMTATIEDAAGKEMKFRSEKISCSRSAPNGILSDQVPPMIGQRNRKGTLVTRRAGLLKLLIFALGQERDQDQGRWIDGMYICPPEVCDSLVK